MKVVDQLLVFNLLSIGRAPVSNGNIRRNGRIGALYLTIAPRTGVVRPISVKMMMQKKTQNQNIGAFCLLNLNPLQ